MKETLSEYAREFNSSCKGWTEDKEQNLHYLLIMQAFFNGKLEALKKVYLSDVYETLGIPVEKKYVGVGWDANRSNSDGFIDFGIFTDYNFKNEGSNIILDFNVDGVIAF